MKEMVAVDTYMKLSMSGTWDKRITPERYRPMHSHRFSISILLPEEAVEMMGVATTAEEKAHEEKATSKHTYNLRTGHRRSHKRKGRNVEV